MADRARHAFGALENIDNALKAGKIDAYDILFVKDANGKPYVGWIDKDGQQVIVDDTAELEALETELATKAAASDVEALSTEVATKANAEEVEAKLAEKANAAEVEAKFEQVSQNAIDDTKAYVDGKVKAAVNEHLAKMYEIADVPVGTLVNYGENEIRVMCPVGTEFTKQSVGVGGDANSYYMTFKTYAPSEEAVGYIEHLGDKVDAEILTTFSTDKYGRRYQPTWLALASYDEATDTWNYYGKNSSAEKFIGWDYQIDWYNADGVMIASDSVRINLSNENCHSSIEPYYVGTMMNEIENKIETKIEEMTSIKVIEF